MQNLENNANDFLIVGSFSLAIFYQILAYLGISTAQVLTLFLIFMFSGLVGFLRTFALNENLKAYIFSDLLAKTLLLFIPFIVAMIAKNITALYIFVDYVFSFLILGELLSILVNIQSIKTRKPIQEIDFYNIFVDKIKQISLKFLKIERQDFNDNDKKEN
ncbi:phage holin family protein [Campylobacter jejuni]|uniref:phage holin family protein n=1 Tax=Campylobacter jejuni TaxID=197 RepID=UPI00073DDA3F|nr:phage holin family protein [Campylobacter jejuni]ALW15597.1 membrane protein [Campylobacter jejuni]MBX1020837.1 phage holin family protein [Campylobacter jejuni]